MKKNINITTLRQKLKKMTQKELRDCLRQMRKECAEVEFYLDIRNEQGRGGK